MADKKSSEDEFTDENFDDEFEFEEEETREPNSALSTVKKGSPQKYAVLGISIAVVGFIGYFGYRFFYAKQTSPSLAQSTVTQAASSSTVKPSQTTGKAPSTKPATPSSSTTAGLPGKTQPSAITEQDLGGLLNPKVTASQPKESKEVVPEKQKEMATTLVQPEKQAEKQKEATPSYQPEAPPAATTVIAVNPVSSQDTSATPSTESAKPAELSKLAEPAKPAGSSPPTDLKKTEGISEAAIMEVSKSEPLPVGEPTATAAATAATAIAAGTSVPTPPPSAAATPNASVSPAPSPPQNAVEMQAFHQQTQKTLEAFTKLNQQMENNLNQIKYLDSYTREVSLNVEKLSAQVTAMDNRIQALTHLANSLSKDLGKVRNEVGYVKRVIGDEGSDIASGAPTGRQRNMDYPYPNALEDGIDCNGTVTATRKKGGTGIRNEDLEYVVHAVIPGRAWLKSAKGQIITVTEGENLGNYGKILVIDASNGVVLTSSGVTFR